MEMSRERAARREKTTVKDILSTMQEYPPPSNCSRYYSVNTFQSAHTTPVYNDLRQEIEMDSKGKKKK